MNTTITYRLKYFNNNNKIVKFSSLLNNEIYIYTLLNNKNKYIYSLNPREIVLNNVVVFAIYVC